MYLGRLVEEGPVDSVLAHPAHPYTRLLVETVPDPERPNRNRAPMSGEPPSPIDPPSGCAFHPRCPVAIARCKSERPDLRAVTPSTHAACHIA